MASGSKTTTTVNDPFANMPDWLRDEYQANVEQGNELFEQGQDLGPKEHLGMNESEIAAFDQFVGGADASNALGAEAQGIMSGLSGGDATDFLSGVMDQNPTGGFDHGYDATDFTGASGYEAGTSYTGDRLTDMIGGGRDFMSEYTDDVVDTTLAGMTRQDQRDQLARDARGAAVGGTSNTRGAVADAVAGNLSNMSKAQMEAQLRDQAHQFGTNAQMQAAGLLDASDQFGAGQLDASNLSAAELALQEAGMGEESNQFLSGQNLEQQGMENANTQWLTELLGDANQFGMNFDMDRAQGLDAMAGSQLNRSGSIFDIMNAFGEKERGIDQANEDAGRDQVNWLTSLLQGTNTTGTAPTGGTQSATEPGNSALQNIIGIGSGIAGAWMSDERTKEDIETPDTSALSKIMSINNYEYNYKDGYGHTDKRTSGLMAQDLEKSGIKGAVTEIDGIKHVDPYPVLSTVVQAVQELAKEREVA